VQAHQVLAVMDQASLKANQRQLLTQLEQVQRQWQQTLQQQRDLRQETNSTALISKAQIGSSFGEVAKAKATLDFAANEMRRYGDLAKSGAVPLLLSQEKAARYSLAISELQQARLGVAQQRARQTAELAKLRQGDSGLSNGLAELARQAAVLKSQLNEAQRALSNATIRAPIKGSVVATSLNQPGQVLSAGEVIARLAPVQAPMEAKLLITGQEIGKIRLGQKTYLRINGCPYSDFGLMAGTVTAIAADAVPVGKASNNTQPAFEVSVQPSAKAFHHGKNRCDLRLGMDLRADVLTGRNTVMGFLLRKLRLATQT
jgi:HlyD family secretion protein